MFGSVLKTTAPNSAIHPQFINPANHFKFINPTSHNLYEMRKVNWGPRLFHLSSYWLGRASTYKWSLRPDLRKVNPDEQLKQTNYQQWKEEFIKNAQWYRGIDPDLLEKKWAKMISTKSYRLPKAGFRIGLLQIMLVIATKPSHLRIVQQALTLIQQKEQDIVFDSGLSTLFCRAAVRINAPEIGLSFIQMPWLKIWPTRKSISILLSKYAQDAEKYFINRLSAGNQPVLPDYLKIDGLDDEPEVREKKEAKKLDLWLSGFTETYKELRSDRHAWKDKLDPYAYSPVIRCYASLGDVDGALDIYKFCGKASAEAVRDIVLSLISRERVEEAQELLKQTEDEKKLAKGKIATYLALNDLTSTLRVFKEEDILTKNLFETHFGKDQRKKLLKDVLNCLKSEGKEIPSEVEEYVSSFPGEDVKEEVN